MEDVEALVPPGWLRDYLHVVTGARFPLSFHLLSGMFALSTVVGRRARLRRAGYRLYPPIWTLLLGTSGVGKGKSMWIAERVVRSATSDLPYLLHSPDTFTRRGLVRACQELVPGPDGAIEGAIFIDEISSVLAKRTGTENNVQFFIKASDMGTIEDLTGILGVAAVRDFTVGFCATTTVELLRESVSASVFSGGFMHRFLIAHELVKPNTRETEPDGAALAALGVRAREIREAAPAEIGLDADGDRLLRALSRRSEVSNYPTTRLAGFWNRLDGTVARVAIALALSGGRYVITGDDVRRAERLVTGYLYPPLEELVEEMAYGPAKRALFQIADDLYCIGPRGMAMTELEQKLPGSTRGELRSQLAFLQKMNLYHEGTGPDGAPWVWRLAEWVTSPNGNGSSSHDLTPTHA